METIFKVSIGFIVGLFILYRLLRPSKTFQGEINEILTDEKYKVKGQYD